MYILDNFFFFLLHLQLRKDASCSVQLILIHATVFECFLTSHLPVSFISLRQQQYCQLSYMCSKINSDRKIYKTSRIQDHLLCLLVGCCFINFGSTNAVMFYSIQIFKDAGLDVDSYIATIILRKRSYRCYGCIHYSK